MVDQFNKSASRFTSQASALNTSLAQSSSYTASLSRRASSAQLTTAKQLGSLSPGGTASVKDSVGRGNPTDFMQLELTSESRLRLALTNRSNIRISALLLDASGQPATVRNGNPSLSVAAGQKDETLFKGLGPGTYYLRIKSAPKARNQYEANLFVNRSGGPAPLPCDCGI
jgi:hypothetical protein